MNLYKSGFYRLRFKYICLWSAFLNRKNSLFLQRNF